MFGLCLPFARVAATPVMPPRGWRRHGGGILLRPRRPRSCPIYAVSDRHPLLDPIRPTREHIAISPHSGLYAMPSLCGSAEATRGRFRAFATIPSWHAALYDPG